MAGWRSLIALGVCLAAAVQLVASTPITEYVAMAPAGGGGGPDRAATTVSSSATLYQETRTWTRSKQSDDAGWDGCFLFYLARPREGGGLGRVGGSGSRCRF